jgi:hypothetical protein
MAYDGETMNACGAFDIDCSRVAVVAVSGSGPNVCGHLLLATNSGGNNIYFHVAVVRGNPKYMTETGYQRYLKDNGKSEIRRRHLSLPNPNAATTYLEGLMSDTWTWGGIPNNCVAFVEEVIHAGGGDWSSYSNCPSLATQDSIGERATRFMSQLENEIFRSYGVPGF